MKKKEKKSETALQKNYAFTQLDDYNTRTHILPILLNDSLRKEIIAEHKENPFGFPGCPNMETKVYSAQLARVIDKLRVQPTPGKIAIFESESGNCFELVKLPEKRGAPVQFLDLKFNDRATAEHEVFRLRLKDLLISYGFEEVGERC